MDYGELLDLDIDVASKGKQLEVADVRIHMVSGVARYTYDEHDKRIPLVETKSHMGKDGKGKEHGGDYNFKFILPEQSRLSGYFGKLCFHQLSHFDNTSLLSVTIFAIITLLKTEVFLKSID